MKKNIAMYKTGIWSGYSLFALLSGFFFLFFFSSSVLASPEELEAVRQQIQNNGARWQAAETSISKLPAEERLMRLGLREESFSVPEGTPVLSPVKAGRAIPASLNYNNDSYVTPIRYQGRCPCCWAFAAAATLESQVLMSTGGAGASVLELSVQILLSCSGSPPNGSTGNGANFIQSTGLPPESCYPFAESDYTSGPYYACSDAACPYWRRETYSIKGWKWVATTAPTVDVLKSALNTYGPLATTMQVYEDFFYYTGGVYSYTYGTYQGAHAIEIIGYDDSNNCFIAKNSWGTWWGESEPGSVTTAGFFRIAYDQVNMLIQFGYYTSAYEGYKGSAPGAPAIGTVTAGNAQATVSFTPPASNGGMPITGYTVTSDPKGGVDANAGKTSTIHTVKSLKNGTAYTFTVTATNKNGTGPASAPSTPSVIPATAPGAPTGIKATVGNARVTVSFTAPASNGGSAITGYTVTWTPTGGVDTNAGENLTTHIVTWLTNGTTYTFTVKAINAMGTGPASHSIRVTPR
jgi:C1A family cysteine protease